LKKKVSLKIGVDKILSTASTTRVSHETNESAAKTLVVAAPESIQAALLANPSRANFNKYRKSMKQSRDKPQSSLHAASQVSAQSEGRDSRSNCKPTNTHDRNRSNREDRRDKPYRERDRERGTGTTTGGCMLHGPKAYHTTEQCFAMKKMVDERNNAAQRDNQPRRVHFDGQNSSSSRTTYRPPSPPRGSSTSGAAPQHAYMSYSASPAVRDMFASNVNNTSNYYTILLYTSSEQSENYSTVKSILNIDGYTHIKTVIDSGASLHIFIYRYLFDEYKPCVVEIVVADGVVLYSEGVGRIGALYPVLYVPTLKFNLV
jgi:hypothetical protein